MSRDRSWTFTIDTLPGSPHSARLLPVFELLFGDDALLKTTRLADSALDPGNAASFLAHNYPVYQSRTKVGHQLFVYGPGDDFVLVAFSLRPGAGGHLSGLLSGIGPDVLIERVGTIVDLLEAPFAAVHDGQREAGIARRTARHREAAKHELGRVAFPFWVRWGLPGLAYRTMLGGPFVSLIGEQRFESLSDDRCRRQGRHWIVAGCAQPERWTFDPMCDEERALVEHFGPEHFFDVETGRLPTALPDLPDAPGYPVTVRDPASGELTTISG